MAYSKYFINPKKKDSNIDVLVDSSITNKFRLCRIKVNGSANFVTDSYAVAVAVDGNAEINSTKLASTVSVVVGTTVALSILTPFTRTSTASVNTNSV